MTTKKSGSGVGKNTSGPTAKEKLGAGLSAAGKKQSAKKKKPIKDLSTSGRKLGGVAQVGQGGSARRLAKKPTALSKRGRRK